MSGFKTAKAVLGRRVLATTAALALATAGVLVGTSSADAASAQTGGTLYFITHADQFDQCCGLDRLTSNHSTFHRCMHGKTQSINIRQQHQDLT